jgi:serine/threonine protein kinase/formylglycine-generating enzyme required for sulfatase activity
MGSFSDQSDESLRLFAAVWERGQPDLLKFVAERELSPETVLKLVEVDLPRRWDRGDCPSIEDYLEQLPQLRKFDGSIYRLVSAEREARRQHNCEVPDEEFRLRFPGFLIGPPLDGDQTADLEAFPETIARTGSESHSDSATVETVIGASQDRRSEPPPTEAMTPRSEAPQPQSIGRYTISQTLGQGGSGIVYRAFDEELGRDVAIKVPRPEVLTENPGLAREYRHEARVVAQLDHDHIVRIYDVNSTDDLPCYLVTQFISGQALADRMRGGGLNADESVELIVAMADALQHAHSHGVVHRDVKPGNILVDESGKPWLADFGLALNDDSIAQKGEYAGTPSYMSPEQASGEGHRIDGRSDVFSLGIVLYELLTRKRPFRGDTTRNVMRSIRERDAAPLRQLNSSIPKELERICLKALARQISDRYATASDLAEELRLWQKSQQLRSVDVGEDSKAIQDSSSVDTFVVPKGLRSFDEHDASFFVSLLPGARGRDGLPESVRFWKSRIEETEAASTFSVGLVYGPSGCGKSSLIRAGVIPQLERNVTAVYVEATPHDTESRILRAVKAAVGSSSDEQTLPELFQSIRRAGRKKLVLFVDQFEQWLQTHRDPDSELVRALRQCDGGNLQAVVMVRDDFWLAASRFMRELDIRIKEGDNSNLVDLFPLSHAEHVLTVFGQARGDLPQKEDGLSEENREFIQEAVKSLAQEDKVVCIRLALFAEMIRGKEWLPATLEKMGGTSGIGMTFLEETFSSPSAPIEHRVHQAAARNVLRALLPVAGTQLKGHMIPVEKLQEVSGYATQPREFEDLILVLDQKLRLITPTDPLGQRVQEDNPPQDAAQNESRGESGVCFQLTHDYLVPTLSDWLHLKQRETRRGRAELLLTEQALWQDRQHGKPFLPSLWEWLSIRVLTDKQGWSDAERAMMRASDRLYLTRFSAVSAVVLLLAAGLFYLLSSQQQAIASQQETNDRAETDTLVTIMLGAPGSAFPYTRQLVLPFHKYAEEDLHRRLDAGGLTASQELHARLYVADFGEIDVDFLVESIGHCDSSECANIVKAIRPLGDIALTRVQSEFQKAQRPGGVAAAARLAIVALALGDTAPATKLARTEADPWPRTVLIRTLAEWNCELDDWAKSLRSVEDPSLCSALCLGIGSVLNPSSEVAAAWEPVWQNWYRKQSDAVTHSASMWALKSWKLQVPDDFQLGEKPERGWYHTQAGVVLLRIPAGKFSRIDAAAWQPTRHTVKLPEEFWASDREISVAQYRQFLKESGKEVGWTDPSSSPEFQFPAADARWPMQSVTWFEAAAFCNWLSRKEGLDPAYLLTDPVERPKGIVFQVEKLADANGFRLPTEAEWEYFARAGTRTSFACGDHQSPVEEYANYGAASPIICGSLKCNAWGLFDTHGNVLEWCQDLTGRYPDTDVVNPQGSTDTKSYCYRGGGWFNGRRNCRSEIRKAGPPLERRYTLGFRVVRNAR